MRQISKILGKLILFLAFYLAILRTLIVGGLKVFHCYFPGFVPIEEDCIVGHPWLEVFFWFSISILAVWILIQRSSIIDYLSIWRINLPLIAFLFWSMVSVVWSVFLAGSIYKISILLFSSIIASYFAIRYSFEVLIKYLAGFVIACTLASLILVAVPGAGITPGPLHAGAWRGIFGHKNFFGSYMAFGNVIFLYRLFGGLNHDRRSRILDLVLYLTTLILVLLSRSASGLIIMVAMHLIFGITLIIVRMGRRLKAQHYIGGGIILVSIGILTLMNIDPLLGLIGRNASLTGRVPLWEFLISNYANQRPILGSGFGVFWSGPVQDQARAALGWRLVPSADNGYLDIYLNLGLVGLVLLGILLIDACVSALKFAYSRRDLIGFLPLALVGYVVITNLSLSYFMEFEWLAWMLLVMVLFLTSKSILYKRA